ncbi:MAG: hypothetical protein WD800_04735, partial [Dehalococcoidia bacterium]
VPLQLYDDAGSANTAHLFSNLLTRLQVKHLTHLPGNPRAKGAVESTMNIVETQFESRLALGERVRDLAELNRRAHQWMRWFNATRLHTRHGHTRYGLWQTIRENELRIAPPRELLRSLLTTRPQTCTVTRALTVRHSVPGFGSLEYSVAQVPGVMVGAKVDVCVNPYAAPDAWLIQFDDAGAEQLLALSPLVRDLAGFRADAPVLGESFARKPDTAADTARKRMERDAYGVDTQEQADTAKKRREQPFAHIDAVGYLDNAAHYMERRGTTLPIERPRVEVAPLTVAQAAKALRARGVQMTKERYTRIASRYPNGVREEDLDRLAQMFGAGAVELQQEQKVVRMK